MIDAIFLALKIAYLVKQSGKKRFSISQDKLKNLAQKEVLSIPYLQKLKFELEELGYFFGSLRKGKYALLVIDSLEGAPSLPLQQQTLDELGKLTEEQLQESCCTQSSKEIIADSEKDEKTLQLEELWKLLIKEAKNISTTTYGKLAIELSKEFGYKIHHKKVMVLLESITQFCQDNQLPPLTYLAINDRTGLPKTLEKETNAKDKFEQEMSRITLFSWEQEKEKFDAFLNKDKEN